MDEQNSTEIGRLMYVIHVILATHYLVIGFLVEGFSKHCDHKDVDEERDEKSDRCLDEEVLVSFLYFLLITAIDFPRLVNEDKENYAQHSSPNSCFKNILRFNLYCKV